MSKKMEHAATLAAMLMNESHWVQCNPDLRAAYREATGAYHGTVATHAAARDALALLRIGKGVSRRAVQACNGIDRYQGNGIFYPTWTEADEAAKEKADAKALKAAQAIADRYLAKVTLGGDPRGYVMRLYVASGATNGFSGDGWGVA